MSFLSELSHESMDNKTLHFKDNSTISGDTQWLITLSSILSSFNGDYVNAIETGKDNEIIADGLNSMWKISDRDSFLDLQSWLVNEGQRGEYSKQLNLINFLYHETFEKGLPVLNLFGGRLLSSFVNIKLFLTQRDKIKAFAQDLNITDGKLNMLLPEYQDWLELCHKKKIAGGFGKVSSLLAWDAVRLVNICRWSVQLGYINESEFLAFAGPLTEQVKNTYQNWDEVLVAYAIGGFIWDHDPVRVEHMLRTFKMLQTDKKSPIKHIPFN